MPEGTDEDMINNTNKESNSDNHRSRSRCLTIGVLFPNLEEVHYNEEFWGIADVARECGATVICFAGGRLRSPIKFRSQRTAIYDLIDVKHIDGLIIWDSALGLYVSADEIVEFCGRYHSLAVVSLSGRLPGIPSVTADDRQGIRETIAHLVNVHACRRLTFIPGQHRHHSGDLARHRAFEALAALPDGWLVDLKQSAEEADIERLSSVIKQIRELDAALADALPGTSSGEF